MLEEILQEIEATEYPVPAVTEAHLVASLGFGMAKEMIAGIIRRHMEDDGWIPCEESMPEKDGPYLLSLPYEDGSDGIVAIFNFVKKGGFSGKKNDFDTFHRVNAWQPLPQYYRPKQKAVGGDYKQRIMDRFMKVE